MLRRRRHVAYSALFFVAIWTLVALRYFDIRSLTASISPHSGSAAAEERMAAVARRADELSRKLDGVERAIAAQAAENRRLYELLRRTTRRTSLTSSTTTTPPPPPPSADAIAVLVLACNRPQAVTNHLDQLLRLRPSSSRFPVIVSQDCAHADTTAAIRAFGSRGVTLIEQPDQSDIVVPPKMKKFVGYYKVSRHYRWALDQVFLKFGYSTVIVTEDDLDLAVDFFDYFTATRSLLQRDSTLMCVSAWNDNGKATLIEKDPRLLFRTDFFPGLGWMLTGELWAELRVKWPDAFWDDWLRNPEQRRDRACIRPEMPRAAMSAFGKVGVSKGQYFDKHLKLIERNEAQANLSSLDLSYLLKDDYDRLFVARVYAAPSITQPELRAGHLNDGAPLPPDVRLTYADVGTFRQTAKAFGLMDDFRAGVPRMAYRGVVPFVFDKTRVFLAPPATWTDYDPTWK